MAATKTRPKPPAKKATKKAPEVVFSGKPKTGKKAVPAKKTKPAATEKASTATAKVGKKAAPAKKPAATKKGTNGQSLPRVLNEHGFVVGSDSEKIVNILLEGGADRSDINAKVTKAIGKRKTRNGNDQNVSSLIANVLKRLRDKGYKIESTWILVPPTDEEKAKAARKAKRAKGAGKTPAKA